MYIHLFVTFTMTHFSCTIRRISTPTMIKQIHKKTGTFEKPPKIEEIQEKKFIDRN